MNNLYLSGQSQIFRRKNLHGLFLSKLSETESTKRLLNTEIHKIIARNWKNVRWTWKSHCKMSITKDQSLKVSCSSREVALNIHYIFLVRNVQEVPTFCHGSCVSFNHLLVTCRGDQIACANQRQCIRASYRCDGGTNCGDGSDEQCSKYCGW